MSYLLDEGAKRMMNIDDVDKGFEFDVHHGDRDLNQKRYEDIGEVCLKAMHSFLWIIGDSVNGSFNIE